MNTQHLVALVLCAAGAAACGGGGGSKAPLPQLSTVVSHGSLIGRYSLSANDQYPKRIDTLRIEHGGTEGEIGYSIVEPSGAVRGNPPLGSMKPGESATITIEALGLSYTNTQLRLTFTYLERKSTDQFDVPFGVVTNDGRFPGGKLQDVLTVTPPPDRHLLTPDLSYPRLLGSATVKYTAPTGLPVKFEVVDQLGHVVANPAAGTLVAVPDQPDDPQRSAVIQVRAARSTFGAAGLVLRAQYDVLAHADELRMQWPVRNVAPPYLAALVAIRVLSDDDPLIGSRFWLPLQLAPYGVVVKHPSDPRLDRVPGLKFTEIELVGSMRLGLTAGQLGKAFWADKATRGGSGEALFPPGQGRNGYTVHPNREAAQQASDYLMVHMTMEHSVPTRDSDPKNVHVYTFAFDSDLSAANDYTPSSSVPNDFHSGTDRWYEAMYDATNGWTVTVTQVDSSNQPAEVASAARVILSDNSILLVVPKSEFPAASPTWRAASFVYQPATPNWSGDVMPVLGSPLLVVR